MAKRFLNELLWHPEKSLEGVDITYVHRGAPKNVKKVTADELAFEKSFFVIKNHVETRIPYHRITQIKKGDEILWKKRTAK
jgi:uncharacterized protein (UPF0248 family)